MNSIRRTCGQGDVIRCHQQAEEAPSLHSESFCKGAAKSYEEHLPRLDWLHRCRSRPTACPVALLFTTVLDELTLGLVDEDEESQLIGTQAIPKTVRCP